MLRGWCQLQGHPEGLTPPDHQPILRGLAGVVVHVVGVTVELGPPKDWETTEHTLIGRLTPTLTHNDDDEDDEDEHLQLNALSHPGVDTPLSWDNDGHPALKQGLVPPDQSEL